MCPSNVTDCRKTEFYQGNVDKEAVFNVDQSHHGWCLVHLLRLVLICVFTVSQIDSSVIYEEPTAVVFQSLNTIKIHLHLNKRGRLVAKIAASCRLMPFRGTGVMIFTLSAGT